MVAQMLKSKGQRLRLPRVFAQMKHVDVGGVQHVLAAELGSSALAVSYF